MKLQASVALSYKYTGHLEPVAAIWNNSWTAAGFVCVMFYLAKSSGVFLTCVVVDRILRSRQSHCHHVSRRNTTNNTLLDPTHLYHLSHRGTGLSCRTFLSLPEKWTSFFSQFELIDWDDPLYVSVEIFSRAEKSHVRRDEVLGIEPRPLYFERKPSDQIRLCNVASF